MCSTMSSICLIIFNIILLSSGLANIVLGARWVNVRLLKNVKMLSQYKSILSTMSEDSSIWLSFCLKYNYLECYGVLFHRLSNWFLIVRAYFCARGYSEGSCRGEPALPVTMIISGISLVIVTFITTIGHLCKKCFAKSGSCFSTRYVEL